MLKLEQIISKSDLEDLYLTQKLSDAEIGNKYGVLHGRIHRLRNRYNIKAIEYYQRHHKQELTQYEKEFIIGTVLGDAHIRRRGKKHNYQLMFEQTTKHHEYVLWLKDQMKDWLYNADKPLTENEKPNKNGKIYHSYSFARICHPVFKEFYEGFYVNNNKIINAEFIDKYFTPLSLSVWLMDDGTKHIINDRIIICSHGFSKQENNMLSNYLFNKFDLKSNVIKSTKYYYIEFTKTSSRKVTELCKNFVIDSMQYKLISSETTKEEINTK